MVNIDIVVDEALQDGVFLAECDELITSNIMQIRKYIDSVDIYGNDKEHLNESVHTLRFHYEKLKSIHHKYSMNDFVTEKYSGVCKDIVAQLPMYLCRQIDDDL